MLAEREYAELPRPVARKAERQERGTGLLSGSEKLQVDGQIFLRILADSFDEFAALEQ